MKISNAMIGGVLGLALVLVGISSPAFAGPLVLSFEGLQNFESVDQFYNGGTGSLGSGPNTGIHISIPNAMKQACIRA